MGARTRKVLLCCFGCFAHLSWSQTLEKVMSADQMLGIHHIWDSNADGQASLAEATAYVERHRRKVLLEQATGIVKVMDTDQDGHVSIAELQKDLEEWKISDDDREKVKDKFEVLDLDKNSLLDPAELPLFFSYAFRFRKYDSDDDGALGFKEWRRGVEKKQQQPVSAEAEKAIKKEGKAIFRKLDIDGNKKLSLEEFFAYDSGIFAAKEALRTLYEISDTDTDAHLSADEMDEVRGSSKFPNTNAYHHLKSWIKAEEL